MHMHVSCYYNMNLNGLISVFQIMFSSVLQKRLPAESGINVVCVSPGIVHTNVVRYELSSLISASDCIHFLFVSF